MKKDPIYFIALIPPESIREEVKAFKKLAATRFQSKRALNSPAHITLQPPFPWPENRVDEIHTSLKAFAQTQVPFLQELRDFDCFKPRVIFVNVILHAALQNLAASLKTTLIPILGQDPIDTRPYHPHMTIAFKDLKPHFFYPAWAYFSKQTFARTFKVDALYLLKHNSKEWEVVERFGFEPM